MGCGEYLKYKITGRDNLLSFLKNLMEDYRVYGPVENEGPVEADDEYRFDELSSIDKISLKHPPTMIPPKKYFFPNEEKTLEIDGLDIREPVFEEKFVIFGVHACDIKSFLILDKMFSKGPYTDFYYQRRRKNSVVIGIDCEPTEYCFCKSMGAERVGSGFDLFLTKIMDEDRYIVEIGSEVGKSMTSSEGFESVDREFAVEIIKESLEWKEEISVETENLTEATLQSFGSEDLWGELGERCLGCGNCTMVCPCCNCFDVKDTTSVVNNISRLRTWTACTLFEFAEVSGGNFRESIKSRYRNWFFDKFRIFPGEIEEFGCVGCGRCIRACPVDIDPRLIIQEVGEKIG